jgi:hypothetical protein
MNYNTDYSAADLHTQYFSENPLKAQYDFCCCCCCCYDDDDDDDDHDHSFLHPLKGSVCDFVEIHAETKINEYILIIKVKSYIPYFC